MLRFRLILTVALLLAFLSSVRAEEASPLTWAKHMGKLAFTVGHERGTKEVEFTGKAPMYFFSSKKGKVCQKFGARTFSDPKILKLVEDYTPILIDTDAEENKALKVDFAIVLLPAVAWSDFEGGSVFMALGDSPVDVFRTMAEIARDRAPKKRKPGEGQEELEKLTEAMQKAAKGRSVAKTLAAVAAVKEFGRGAAAQLEAWRIDAELTKKGEERLAKAKALLEKKKKSSAKKILKKLVADYGEHPVGKRAEKMLSSISG
ncbi:MAG: hypothetical protein ACYTDY_15610 [Planctomycetota bacterium]|jgi:hypothetical protein